jgi:hypothetical protein
MARRENVPVFLRAQGKTGGGAESTTPNYLVQNMLEKMTKFAVFGATSLDFQAY